MVLWPHTGAVKLAIWFTETLRVHAAAGVSCYAIALVIYAFCGWFGNLDALCESYLQQYLVKESVHCESESIW